MVFAMVLLFGALGVLVRYASVLWIPAGVVPWAILFVNAIGSFLAGVVGVRGVELFGAKAHLWVPAIMTGFLGGFTTFSAFAYDTVRLAQSGAFSAAALNFFLNNGVALSMCFLGYKLGRV